MGTAREQQQEQQLAASDAFVDALKFVIHFVGDIHQPLHVGFTTDEVGQVHGVRLLYGMADAPLLGREHSSRGVLGALREPSRCLGYLAHLHAPPD